MQFENDTERIMHAANFMYKSQGYVDTALTAKMVGVPVIVIARVLELKGFVLSGGVGQYIKNK